MEHNKPNWDKLQAISVLTSDSPKLGPALKKNPYIYVGEWGGELREAGWKHEGRVKSQRLL